MPLGAGWRFALLIQRVESLTLVLAELDDNSFRGLIVRLIPESIQ
jgi:hypothetical protein